MAICGWCSHEFIPIEVHGHVQCANCKTSVEPCCEGHSRELDQQTCLQDPGASMGETFPQQEDPKV